MTNGNPNPSLPSHSDDHVKLYLSLVDQILKYMSTMWQVPTALLAANGFVLDKFYQNPYVLLPLSVFNAAIIYAFHKMRIRQNEIIAATQHAEANLRSSYPNFIPIFSPSKLSSSLVMLSALIVLDAWLFGFSLWEIHNISVTQNVIH